MQLISFRGYNFEDNGFTAGVYDGDRVGNWSVLPSIEPRQGGTSVLTGGVITERVVPIEFTHPGPDFESAFQRLLGALQPEDTDNPGALIAVLGADDTEVSVEAIVTLPGGQAIDGSVNSLEVVFVAADPFWRATTETTATLTTTAVDGALALPVAGHARVRPVVTLKPTAIRAGTPTTTKGWKYRKQITLTNNGTETLDRFPYRLALGSTTTGLVASGKMQADGDDVRIWFEGEDLPRTLVTMNTTATYAWIIIDGLPAGESRTYDIIYGNANAANPLTLSRSIQNTQPDFPPFTLSTSTNAQLLYPTDETAGNHRLGLWPINSAGRPDFDVPGGWKRFLMLENRDDYNQSRYDPYVASGNKQHGILDAERRREGSVRLQEEGQADGVWLHWPTGIISIVGPFRYLNIAANSDNLVGTGKIVIMARESGGESWETVFERSDVQNTEITIGSTTYSMPAPYPREWYLGILPQDEVEIPQSCRGTSKCQFRNGVSFTVNTNTDAVISAGAITSEVDIWDAYGRLQIVPGGDSPSYAVDLGGSGLSAGTDGNGGRLAVPINNTLIIDADRRTIEEWNGALTTLISRREFAGVFTKIDALNGVAIAKPTHDWLLIKPRPVYPNGTFDANVTGYGAIYTASGLTATIVWDGTVFHSAAGSLKMAISANTAASGEDYWVGYTTLADAAPVLPGQTYAVSAWARTSNANVEPLIAIDWKDAAGGSVGDSREASWIPVINTWSLRFFSAVAPAGAAYAAIRLTTNNKTASPGAANVWWDEVTEGNLLTHADLDTSIVVTAKWHDSYYG